MMKRRTDTAGYSLIEVMTAVAIMIVGSAGISMMVGATSRANGDAWEGSIAQAFAATWMERMKRDSLLWTAAGAPAGVQYLAEASTWAPPVTNFPVSGESRAADSFGWDTNEDARMRYCALVQSTAMHRLQSSLLTTTLRVDVRVVWNRTVRGDSVVSDRRVGPAGSGCNSVPDATSLPFLREVYLSSVVHAVEP